MNLHHHKTPNLNLQLFKFMLYSGRGKLYTISALNKQRLNAPEGHSILSPISNKLQIHQMTDY